MLWRNADFSCHAARRGAPTTARGRVRCAVAISNALRLIFAPIKQCLIFCAATTTVALNEAVQLPEVESSTHGSRPRPRTQKNPRPRPRARVFSKKNFFSGDLQKKKIFKKIFASDTFWTRSMAQKAINIAANWASEQELQFSSKKTEIVLFTHKRNPDLGSLLMNRSNLELSKEARLLGVTLDCKLSWKPHINRITRKATVALSSSVRRILKRRGGQKLWKIWEEQRSESEIVPPEISPIFYPKSGEEQKKKKKKRSSLKFGRISSMKPRRNA